MGDVLLVDDDRDLLEVMSAMFRELGHARCRVATSLEGVVSQREDALACSVAVIDVNLGRGAPSGVEVYRWLRAEGFAGRVVFLTGHAPSHPDVAEAVRTPDTEVLTKPVGASQLLALVEGLEPS